MQQHLRRRDKIQERVVVLRRIHLQLDPELEWINHSKKQKGIQSCVREGHFFGKEWNRDIRLSRRRNTGSCAYSSSSKLSKRNGWCCRVTSLGRHLLGGCSIEQLERVVCTCLLLHHYPVDYYVYLCYSLDGQSAVLWCHCKTYNTEWLHRDSFEYFIWL